MRETAKLFMQLKSGSTYKIYRAISRIFSIFIKALDLPKSVAKNWRNFKNFKTHLLGAIERPKVGQIDL